MNHSAQVYCIFWYICALLKKDKIVGKSVLHKCH